jgi:hypothetical protein
MRFIMIGIQLLRISRRVVILVCIGHFSVMTHLMMMVMVMIMWMIIIIVIIIFMQVMLIQEAITVRAATQIKFVRF